MTGYLLRDEEIIYETFVDRHKTKMNFIKLTELSLEHELKKGRS